ncbi:hypothetical protein [Spiroplasma endosymbiont of Cleonymus obscurus]|uniref:hypothetical protein n=1 Tax=Spiroplasma endosymbiont of Cleonymus obscurus TaxID=3066324 RepID=UPI0037DD7298
MIGSDISGIWEDISKGFEDFTKDVGNFFEKGWQGIESFFSDLFEGLDFLLYAVPIVIGGAIAAAISVKIYKVITKLQKDKLVRMNLKDAQRQRKLNKKNSPLLGTLSDKIVKSKDKIKKREDKLQEAENKLKNLKAKNQRLEEKELNKQVKIAKKLKKINNFQNEVNDSEPLITRNNSSTSFSL